MGKVSSILAIALVCLFTTGPIAAQEKYPVKPIQSIIPYPPGSPTELADRATADIMTKYLGQPVVSINKGGSGGFIGGAALATSKPDGYTIGMFVNTQAVPETLAKLRPASYSSADVQPVARWGRFMMILWVRGDAPYKSVKELVEYAKKNPGKVRWGHPGAGNRNWVLGAVFEEENGIKMTDVPFGGEAEIMAAALGGHIDMAPTSFAGGIREHILLKKLTPLCVFGDKRFEELPDVPTVKELGFKYLGDAGDLFLGTFVPKKTPKNIVAILSDAIRKVTEDQEFKVRMKSLNLPIVYVDTKDFEDFVQRDLDFITKFFKERGYL